MLKNNNKFKAKYLSHQSSDPTCSIEVNDLKKYYYGKKYYEKIKALDGISFQVKYGEVFGLLGPNGAGKTTTVGVLSGLITPTEGSVFVGGYDMKKNFDKVKALIGVCPQETRVFKFLTGRENIEYFGKLHLMTKDQINEKIETLLKLVGLEAIDRKAKGYSGGMLRKLNLLIALINNPCILFLDEPTVGMDPRARRSIWNFLFSLKSSDKTIILTTHYIEEAESLCDRVAIIDYGQLVAIGTPKELMKEHESKNLEEVFLKLTGRRIIEGMEN